MERTSQRRRTPFPYRRYVFYGVTGLTIHLGESGRVGLEGQQALSIAGTIPRSFPSLLLSNTGFGDDGLLDLLGTRSPCRSD